jgi:hypothetical protein
MCLGYGTSYIVISYVGMEFLSAIMRIPLLHKTGGLNISEFIKNVFCREIIPVLVSFSICYCCLHFIDWEWRFLITFSASVVFYAIAILLIGLTQQERGMLFAMVLKKR